MGIYPEVELLIKTRRKYMKYFIFSLTLVALVLVGVQVADAATCGDGTGGTVICQNGHPDLVVQPWGLTGAETPRIGFGITVTDRGGISASCPVWMSNGCFDLTGVKWYEDRMLELARELIDTNQVNRFPVFGGWVSLAR
jgi:hypothetical protein